MQMSWESQSPLSYLRTVLLSSTEIKNYFKSFEGSLIRLFRNVTRCLWYDKSQHLRTYSFRSISSLLITSLLTSFHLISSYFISSLLLSFLFFSLLFYFFPSLLLLPFSSTSSLLFYFFPSLLFSSLLISSHLFSSLLISSHLFSSLLFSSHLFSSLLISSLISFLLFCPQPSSVSCLFTLFNLDINDGV